MIDLSVDKSTKSGTVYDHPSIYMSDEKNCKTWHDLCTYIDQSTVQTLYCCQIKVVIWILRRADESIEQRFVHFFDKLYDTIFHLSVKVMLNMKDRGDKWHLYLE